MKKIFLFFLLIVPINFCNGQSLVSHLYCTILGNVDIKSEYKEQVHKALKEFGVENPEDVPVKQMNKIGQIVALMPLSSFTAFGIWFDQEALDACSPEKRTFKIFHEAAHYALSHHQELLVTEAALAALAITGLVALNKVLHAKNNHYCTQITVASALATAALVYLGITPFLVKLQEREADLDACKKLLSLDKNNSVAAYLKNLSKSDSTGNLWWFSGKEHAEYLEQALC